MLKDFVFVAIWEKNEKTKRNLSVAFFCDDIFILRKYFQLLWQLLRYIFSLILFNLRVCFYLKHNDLVCSYLCFSFRLIYWLHSFAQCSFCPFIFYTCHLPFKYHWVLLRNVLKMSAGFIFVIEITIKYNIIWINFI